MCNLVKADLNLIKSAFKNDLYDMYGIIDVQISADGAVLRVTKNTMCTLDDAYEDELHDGLKAGLAGTYGKNFYDCKAVKAANTTNAGIQVLREVWENVSDNQGQFTVEQVQTIIDDIAANVCDFVPAKKDIPTNYMLHIGFYNINPIANNPKLLKKKEKAETSEEYSGSVCFDLPMIFIWVDTYTNNHTTTLVRNASDELERKCLTYIGKDKAPLFTAVYPNITAGALDFDGIFISSKTEYASLLSAVGNTFMCDIVTEPVDYARECVDSIVTLAVGGAFTYNMYTTYLNAIGELYAQDNFGCLSANKLVDVITQVVSVIGTDLTASDTEKIHTLYEKFFKEAPMLRDLLRDKHKIKFAARNIEMVVESNSVGCFDDSLQLERRETEHGIEFWYAVKLNSIEEELEVNGTQLLLYDESRLTDINSSTETDENSDDTEVSVENQTKAKLKKFLHKDADTWEMSYAASVIRKNKTDAESVVDDKKALCDLHNEIACGDADTLSENLEADLEELSEKFTIKISVQQDEVSDEQSVDVSDEQNETVPAENT